LSSTLIKVVLLISVAAHVVVLLVVSVDFQTEPRKERILTLTDVEKIEPPPPQEIEPLPEPEPVALREPEPMVEPKPETVIEPQQEVEPKPEPATEEVQEPLDTVVEKPAIDKGTLPRSSSGRSPMNTESAGNARPAIKAYDPDMKRLYIQKVGGRIEQMKSYPLVARKREQEGTVMVRFSLNRSGMITDGPEVTEPSRFSALNEAAVKAVADGAPYPPFDEQVGPPVITFSVPIKFTLQN
jgi:protein TonB